MVTLISHPKLTYREFAAFPDDGKRHEILDGEHVVSPSPSQFHQLIVLAIGSCLRSFVRQHRLGKVLIAPFDVLLSQHDIVEPDVLFVARERLGILGEKYAEGAPDLVVEVLSPSTRRRDLGKKRARYERLGVQEYWVAEPRDQTVQIFRRDGERFLAPVQVGGDPGDVLASPLLPGLEISLAEIFES